MKNALRLLILLTVTVFSQQSSLVAQPCNLCGTTASEWIAGITIDGGSGFFLGVPGPGVGGCIDKVVLDAYIVILKKGVNHSFTLTPGFSGAAQPEYWKIWIDLNHDGDFNDPADLVYASSSGSTTTVNGTFFIPLSVATGAASMRVAMRRGSPPPDCGNYTNGQVLGYSSAYIDECDISFTDACAREYIKQVNIQALNNVSGCGATAYQDFTNISTPLNTGISYPVQLTPGFFNAGQHPERWLIWIDFNKDYDFDDPGEQVFDSGVTGSSSVTTGMINIPLSSLSVTTRMRIKMIPTDVNGGSLDPCDPVPTLGFWPDQYGEAEDYTVNIKGVSLEVQVGSAEDLVKEGLFGGNCFDVKNVTFSGQADQIGSFSKGLTNIGFDKGVILATGSISVAPGPNDSDNASGGYGISTPDADLSNIATGALFDMAGIEFDFTPTQTPFTFEFVFASEEYCEYVNTQFSDVFGFFISGPGITGTQNLAVVPSTSTPISINTINHLVNSGLYTHNTPASGINCDNIPPATGPAVSELQYDGFTRKLTATANVIPCATYHIKFKIADVGDAVWDSAVFLKGGSFDGGGNASIDWLVNGQPGVNEVTEGCGTVGLLIDRLGSSTALPLPVSFSISGTATNGQDYGPLSTTYVIPAGADQVTIPVNIVNDLIPEGSETVVLTLNNACACLQPQEILTILDYKVMVLIADTVSIPGPGLASVGVTVKWGVAPYTYQWSTSETTPTISPFVGTSTTFTVTVTDACGKTSIANARVNVTPNIWTVNPTSRNHTIIIPDTLKSDVFGGGLQLGDRIGMFYDSSGTGILKCGGYVTWQGQSSSFAVYGNDATPPARNGFLTGEVFKVKIWRSASGQVFDATVQYAPIGSLGGLITHANAFADDGISMITSIVGGTTQSIILNNGWNLISSYVVPSHPDMVKVFAPIASGIDIVKNCDGDSYIPLLMINGIGNWNSLEGYQVKANQKDTLMITGQKAVPESNPIPLNAGWQCIGYLRDNPQNIDTVFKYIKTQISLVKNNEGKVYSPQFGINQIGNMLPGQGYKVKALSNVTLSYRPNFTGSPVAERGKNNIEADMPHFVLDSNLNTGNNATIILTDSIAKSVFALGDEIGVFTPSGVLCGAAMYKKENLAITVWEDDPSTNGIIEGMKNAEAYKFRVWDISEQKECKATVTFLSGTNAYARDAIEVIQTLMIPEPTDTTITASACNSYVLNNQIYTSSGSYTQILTNFAGCDSTITLNLTINPIPTVLVSNLTICSGQSATLTASGATNYIWSTGATTSSITVSPNVNSIYTVIGTTMGCTSLPAIAQVTVNPLPNVVVTSDTICSGQTATLTATGAANYLWSNGATTNTITVSPNATTTYTVTGTTAGCIASATSSVTIDLVTIDLGPNITLAIGDTVVLNATCACQNYHWSTGETTSTIRVYQMGAYAVTVTTEEGCTAEDYIVIMTTATNNPHDGYGIVISPNPTKDLLYITCQGASTSSVQIIDELGKVIFTDHFFATEGVQRTLSLKNAPSGLYFVRIVGDGFAKTIPIIKD